jgi:hypothetical protein
MPSCQSGVGFNRLATLLAMKFVTHVLVLGSFFLASCAATSPHACPTGGLDTPRNCHRKCVEGQSGLYSKRLPCECFQSCACWRFSGHPPKKSEETELDFE